VIEFRAARAQPLRLQAFGALVVVGEDGITPATMDEGLGVAADEGFCQRESRTHCRETEITPLW